MRLILHWSLGDHICYSGIPEAYYKTFGEKLFVISERGKIYDDIWFNNSFVNLHLAEGGYKVRVEKKGVKSDWQIYRPQRIFFEMTGKWLDKEQVKPKLYYNKVTVKKRLVVSDEAGWPARRGYKHLNKLIDILRNEWEIIYLRNMNIDHIYGPKQIVQQHCSVSLKDTINLIASCELYIGYDSALAHIAGALDVPYVLITGSVPPVVVRHPSCIFVLEVCEHCYVECCENKCLENSKDFNYEIIEKIKEKL